MMPGAPSLTVFETWDGCVLAVALVGVRHGLYLCLHPPNAVRDGLPKHLADWSVVRGGTPGLLSNENDRWPKSTTSVDPGHQVAGVGLPLISSSPL